MDKICETCIYFRQHYIKFGLEYSPISYGHCVYPRLKKRETKSAACEHYISLEEDNKKDRES
jgi:hypothetical protein